MASNTLKSKNTPEEIQDKIFKKMPAGKKIRLASELSSFCLKLNSLNGAIKPGKNSLGNS